MRTAEYWVNQLGLIKHPEGGFFKEVYRATGIISKEGLPEHYGSNRNYSTSIYFLLTGNEHSAFHRIRSDEIWHFYEGDPVVIYQINEKGELSEMTLGPDFDKSMKYQFAVPSETWFAAKVTKPDGYTLVGCTVSPGFDFDDFELGRREDLIQRFPQHEEIIKLLTKK